MADRVGRPRPGRPARHARCGVLAAGSRVADEGADERDDRRAGDAPRRPPITPASPCRPRPRLPDATRRRAGAAGRPPQPRRRAAPASRALGTPTARWRCSRCRRWRGSTRMPWSSSGAAATSAELEAGAAVLAVVVDEVRADGLGAEWLDLRSIGARLDAPRRGTLHPGPRARELARGIRVLARHRPAHLRRAGRLGAGRPETGREHYPRTDAAVIVAVLDDDDRILLGSNVEWGESRFSLLAGFVEPGESLEAAVVREIFEEAGVVVDRPGVPGQSAVAVPRVAHAGLRGPDRARHVDRAATRTAPSCGSCAGSPARSSRRMRRPAGSCCRVPRRSPARSSRTGTAARSSTGPTGDRRASSPVSTSSSGRRRRPCSVRCACSRVPAPARPARSPTASPTGWRAACTPRIG